MMFKAAVLMTIDVRSWAKSHQIELNLAVSYCLSWDCSSYLYCYGGQFVEKEAI